MMIVASTAIGFGLACSPTISSRAFSLTAEYVEKKAADSNDNLLKSITFGQPYQKSIVELEATMSECSTQNWDGYNAYPVSETTYKLSKEFLKLLPVFLQPNSVGADPDGHITLEWYESKYKILSLSISPEGMLYYAGINGSRRQYGSEPFLGSIPQQILGLAMKVVTA